MRGFCTQSKSRAGQGDGSGVGKETGNWQTFNSKSPKLNLGQWQRHIFVCLILSWGSYVLLSSIRARPKAAVYADAWHPGHV